VEASGLGLGGITHIIVSRRITGAAAAVTLLQRLWEKAALR